MPIASGEGGASGGPRRPEGERHEAEHHAGRDAYEVQLGEQADGGDRADRHRPPARQPAAERARQAKEGRGAHGEEHRVGGHHAGGEPEQRGERDPEAGDRPRPPSAGQDLADEQEAEQRGQAPHQRGQQAHRLQAVEQRATRGQP